VGQALAWLKPAPQNVKEKMMAQSVTRRDFATAGLVLAGLFTTLGTATGKADITIGITVDTRLDWKGPQNFLR